MRLPVDALDNGNAQQREFLEQLDEGVHPLKTNYYKRLKHYRDRTTSNQQIWSKEKLIEYMYERVALYEDVKENGMKEPIIVDKKNNRIEDGNHRHDILRHLGHKEIEVTYKKGKSEKV